MTLYAKPSWRMARQITSDVVMVAWAVIWFLVARAMHGVVRSLATPARKTAETAQAMADSMTSAGERVASLPAVGERLAEPFSSMSGSLEEIVTQANAQIDTIHQIAWISSAVTFAIPVALLLLIWLPWRVRFVTEASAALQFIDADEDLELFALRAMANVPTHQLAAISSDPVGEWRAGNRDVIRRLARLELDRSGLPMPPAAAQIIS